nr:MAG TPA: hypothetical protein [Bacteriophage sp.]
MKYYFYFKNLVCLRLEQTFFLIYFVEKIFFLFFQTYFK